MTDREILKNLWNNGYAQYAIKPQVNDAMNYDIDQALKELRAYYREKIKWVGIAKMLWNAEFADGDSDKSKQCENLANAILKAIDKEMG